MLWNYLKICFMAAVIGTTPVLMALAPADETKQYCSGIKSLLPQFAGFGKAAASGVELLDGNKKVIGFMFLAPRGRYTRIAGYRNFINVAAVVGGNGRIIGVVLGDNEETPRWIRRCIRGGMLTRWNGRTIAEAAAMEVDAVTGATLSSNAIKGEMKAVAGQKFE